MENKIEMTIGWNMKFAGSTFTGTADVTTFSELETLITNLKNTVEILSTYKISELN